MSHDEERIQKWLTALTDSIEELASLNLGMEVSPPQRISHPSPAVSSSASIDLKSSDGNWRVAIAADPDGLQSLAKALLGMEADEENLPNEDVADAFGEVLNILAGGLKKRLSEVEGEILLGLPQFCSDQPIEAEFRSQVLASTSIGTIRTDLMIARVGS